MRKLLDRLFGVRDEPIKEAVTKQMKINAQVLAKASQPTDSNKARIPLEPYRPPDGVIPANQREAALAMDETPYDYLNLYGFTGGFPGYPYLADLSQRPEYRKIVSTLADEMTRKWVEIKAKGEDDKSDKISKIVDAMDRYRVRDLFKQAAEDDGFFGRGQLYFEVKTPSGGIASDMPDELESPLFMDKAKIKKGSLVDIRKVEPAWTYPGAYQSTSPLKKDYYKPLKWYVMGDTVHVSRFAMFISAPVPDMLKAAYNFGGLSMSQRVEPYINNWLRTRNSVGDLIHSFSLSILKTNMQATLQGGDGSDIFTRAQLFNQTRDNRGLMMVDKDTEEVEQINTPLSGVHQLQAQAQEQMAAIPGIPLVKLLGITPSGLNASTDGEIRVFYDTVHSLQESLFRPNLKKTIDIIQLSEFGEIDPDIVFEFVPLHELSEKEEAETRKLEAETDQIYIDAGVVDPDEVRQNIATDTNSQYHGLDLSTAREDLAEEDDDELGQDAAFNESDHPRDSDGKFTDGSGGSTSSGEGNTRVARSRSMASNLETAASEGFDVDDIYVHAGRELEEIQDTGNFPGLFALEESSAWQAAHYGEESYSFVVKGGVWDDSDLSSEMDDEWEDVESFVKKELRNDDIDDDQMERVLAVVKNETLEYDDEIGDLFNAIDDADFYKEAQSLRAKVAAMLGAGAIRMEDEFNKETIMLLPGDKVMMVSRPGVEDDR